VVGALTRKESHEAPRDTCHRCRLRELRRKPSSAYDVRVDVSGHLLKLPPRLHRGRQNHGWRRSGGALQPPTRASHASRSPPAPIMKKLDTLVETNGLSQAPAEAYRADPSRERNRGAARGSPVLPQGAMSRGLQTSKGGQAVARPTIRTGRSASRGRKSFDRATPRVVRWLRDCREATRPRSAHSLVSLG
jgi:hypothetical protein